MLASNDIQHYKRENVNARLLGNGSCEEGGICANTAGAFCGLNENKEIRNWLKESQTSEMFCLSENIP